MGNNFWTCSKHKKKKEKRKKGNNFYRTTPVLSSQHSADCSTHYKRTFFFTLFQFFLFSWVSLVNGEFVFSMKVLSFYWVFDSWVVLPDLSPWNHLFSIGWFLCRWISTVNGYKAHVPDLSLYRQILSSMSQNLLLYGTLYFIWRFCCIFLQNIGEK